MRLSLGVRFVSVLCALLVPMKIEPKREPPFVHPPGGKTTLRGPLAHKWQQLGQSTNQPKRRPILGDENARAAAIPAARRHAQQMLAQALTDLNQEPSSSLLPRAALLHRSPPTANAGAPAALAAPSKPPPVHIPSHSTPQRRPMSAPGGASWTTPSSWQTFGGGAGGSSPLQAATTRPASACIRTSQPRVGFIDVGSAAAPVLAAAPSPLGNYLKLSPYLETDHAWRKRVWSPRRDPARCPTAGELNAHYRQAPRLAAGTPGGVRHPCSSSSSSSPGRSHTTPARRPMSAGTPHLTSPHRQAVRPSSARR